MSSIVQQPASSLSAETLREQYLEIRRTTLRLTEPFSAEDQMLQSMPDASPTKWHLAHTTWFFETFVLQPFSPEYKPFEPRYQYLFNSYYKQVGAHPYRGSRGLLSRPTLATIHDYRKYVDEAMAALLEVAGEDVLRLVELGLNHEQQHQELILTDIKHALSCSPLGPDECVSTTSPQHSASPLTWLEHEGGIYEIGHDGSGFAFDNESPRHEVLLRPFMLGSRPVTNGEYLEFMRESGYKRPELWLSDGWDCVCAQQWNAPLYWEGQQDGLWRHFVLKGMKELDLAEPVCHISYYEADAYARWAGARLPTEEEWECIAARAQSRGTLLEEFVFQPQVARGEGVQQIFGDVWEWTGSPYRPYPGFHPGPGALGEYNGKFMCNQLVLRGGSCATPSSHIRASYRNFFPPHSRWQFSGARLANDRA